MFHKRENGLIIPPMMRSFLPLIFLFVSFAAAQNPLKEVQKAAKKGDANAQYHLGQAYADAYHVKRDYAKAVEWTEKAANQGHDKAQEFLGKLYYTGLGVGQDYAAAAKWLGMAAKLGNPEAQEVFGNMYRDGQGVAKDYARATYWYRMAAEQGFARAQFNLGVSYNNGEGLDADPVQALHWISLAATDPPKEYEGEYRWVRDDLQRSLPQEMIEQARSLSEKWAPKTWEELQDADPDPDSVALNQPEAAP